MELTEINKQLYDAARRLEEGAKLIFKYAKEAAETELQYDREMARAVMELKEEGTPATLIDKLARGKCAEIRYKANLAELTYKACIKSLEAQQTQISALQSITKYQSEV